ncbi:MAG: thiamine-phosphate kinase, partial [Rhodospirillaceae bacterium]|nr:thiamine-phosphate kinase [Rhodospirillaceae bacterium]
DDAALLAPASGCAIVATADAMVAGVHFLPEDPPDLIARKLLRVNLSDLAAMGARPRAYLLTLALPKEIDDDWLAAFAGGLAADQAEFGIHLAGGDTVSTPGPLTLSLTALGEAKDGAVLRRSGAEAGDTVYVTGTIGDAALGLDSLQGRLGGMGPRQTEVLTGRYRLPRPRTACGPRLLGLAHAALDVSDGLVADLGHLCKASGVAAVIEAARVPISEAAGEALAADPDLLPRVLTGGDDYELAFAAPPEAEEAIRALGVELELPVAAIGRCEAGQGVRVVDRDGAALDGLGVGGWRHG